MTPLEAKDRRIAELEARVAELEAQVRDLLAQLGRNSTNSSLSPSRDNAEARALRARKAKSKRRRGGQQGHRRAMRELLPPEEVDEVHELRPSACGKCRRPLRGDDPAPVRRQVTEIPELVALVREYRIHTVECPCGHHTRAEVPPEAQGCFGPRLSALVSLLSGGYRISKRNIQELLRDILGVDLALGSVSKLEARTSEILAAAHEEVLAHVRGSSYVNMDERSGSGSPRRRTRRTTGSSPSGAVTSSPRSSAPTSTASSATTAPAPTWSLTPSSGRSAGFTSAGTSRRRSSSVATRPASANGCGPSSGGCGRPSTGTSLASSRQSRTSDG